PSEKSMFSSCRANRLPTDHAEIADENNSKVILGDKLIAPLIERFYSLCFFFPAINRGFKTPIIRTKKWRGELVNLHYPNRSVIGIVLFSDNKFFFLADGRGQETHFREDVQRCRAHVLDKAERHRAGLGPVPRTGTVRGARAMAMAMARARARGRLARALAELLARARSTATGEPIDARLIICSGNRDLRKTALIDGKVSMDIDESSKRGEALVNERKLRANRSLSCLSFAICQLRVTQLDNLCSNHASHVLRNRTCRHSFQRGKLSKVLLINRTSLALCLTILCPAVEIVAEHSPIVLQILESRR
ncbi:hypothetical protein ALC60_13530, partial [Trachymyrmex zeteki]